MNIILIKVMLNIHVGFHSQHQFYFQSHIPVQTVADLI